MSEKVKTIWTLQMQLQQAEAEIEGNRIVIEVLRQDVERLVSETVKYRMALEEIREIAKDNSIFEGKYYELKAENEWLKEKIAQLEKNINTLLFKKENEEEMFCKQNEELYEEKKCLHTIIDRLLENSGYSKDIASAEEFEDVYEDMQIKRNELNECRKALEEIREIAEDAPHIDSEL